MWLTTYFNTVSGSVTGLSPIVKVRDVDTDAVVVSGTMLELGDGFYAYDFTSYDITKEYAILYDAITLPSSIRYKMASSGEYGDTINTLNILTDNIDIRTALVRKMGTNKLTLNDGQNNNWRLYDDDNSTKLLEWDVSDKLNNPIRQVIRDVSSRTKGT